MRLEFLDRIDTYIGRMDNMRLLDGIIQPTKGLSFYNSLPLDP